MMKIIIRPSNELKLEIPDIKILDCVSIYIYIYPSHMASSYFYILSIPITLSWIIHLDNCINL